MREILFRGKRADNGEWVEGSLLIDPDIEKYYINGFNYYMADFALQREETSDEVIPETVGQYTGLTDKNGNKIFERDICQFCHEGEYTNYEVVWFGSKWVIVMCGTSDVDDLDLFFCERAIVIGNVRDNPELLEV